jgi:hypothetical protein
MKTNDTHGFHPSQMAAWRVLQSHEMPGLTSFMALSSRGHVARLEGAMIRVYLVHKDGLTLWSELPFAAVQLCMSFGSGVHDASWLYVCTRDTLIVRVFDVQEQHHKELHSFELARQGSYLYSFDAHKPWMVVEFIGSSFGDADYRDTVALYEQGVPIPLWVVHRTRSEHPVFTRDGLHVAITNSVDGSERGSLELLRLRDGTSEGFVFSDSDPALLKPFQWEDGLWLTVKNDFTSICYDDSPVWSTPEHIDCFSAVSGLGVVVHVRSTKVLVLTTPCQAKMDAMSEPRVAWMTAVVLWQVVT